MGMNNAAAAAAYNRTFSVRYVHKISPRDTDTHADVIIAGNAFSNRNTLAAELRRLGVLIAGARIREMRIEGDKVVIFSTVSGMTIYWHSVILTAT